ncbi:MAG: dienelactone hydrolase family protein [Nevskia sp.]|nr:dienelactone hydrolase family protein [Nevskia sp.]
MKKIETDAAVTLEPAAPANAAVIWLHGLGADGHDFVPIVPELSLPAGIQARFIFPHAPVRAVTLNGGARMRAWYDIKSLTRGDQQDDVGIRASAATLMALVAEQRKAGIAAKRIVIAGFSQGGAIALHATCRLTEALAGTMALSTYLPLPDTLPKELTEAGKATPILMCHGTADPVLALKLGTDSRDGLRSWGLKIDWHEYPMGHSVCAEEVDDISAWLAKVLV